MMVELRSLKQQLENLISVLQDAKTDDKSLEEIAKIIKQIKEIEGLIDKRLQFISNNQSLN